MEIRERLAVKEWQWSAEPPKSDEGLVRRAELARATPRSNPKSEGTKKARVWSVCGTYDFGVFSAGPLPFISYGKMEGEPSGDPSEDPHPHRHLETGTPKG